jgi:hypothetical protein
MGIALVPVLEKSPFILLYVDRQLEYILSHHLHAVGSTDNEQP